jgi:peptide/nickel transport system ATP-binding protein
VIPALLQVNELRISFQVGGGWRTAVDGLSYELGPGKTLAIIGESGSGKTVGCRALLGLLPTTARVTGSVRFNQRELLGLTEPEMRQYRGRGIAMIFQDPTRALNPTMRIGSQIVEALRRDPSIKRRTARHSAIELLELLRVPEAAQRFFFYPHELSGGMRQRVLIAIALAGKPQLLIADEATRSLDAITQAETLHLLKDLQQQFNMALIMVSHDLRLASSFADDVLVMCAARGVEYAPARQLFKHARMRYTRALLDAIPSADAPRRGRERVGMTPAAANASEALLTARHLVQDFVVRGHVGHRRGALRALADVSFEIRRGETLSVVGESGSGKTTLARALLQIPKPKSGSVFFRGHDLTRLRGRALCQQRRYLQMVFQDPFGSLNPKWNVSEILLEPLIGYNVGGRTQRQNRIAAVLEHVGLSFARHAHRRPRELSGGECQRVAIARALTLDPELIVCDEAVSALDVLIQSQLLSLFEELRGRFGLSYLFISHDLTLVRNISDRVAVLHLGQLCEIAPATALYRRPLHPYTTQLLAVGAGAAPAVASPAPPAPGSSEVLTSSADPPRGCRFHTRCPHAQERCALERPELRSAAEDHWVACHFTDLRTTRKSYNDRTLYEDHRQAPQDGRRLVDPARFSHGTGRDC